MVNTREGRMTPLVVGLAFAGLVACATKDKAPPASQTAATGPDTAIMDEPDAELPTKFGLIKAVTELPDGRLIVVDDKANTVVRADFISAATAIGHTGTGPGEYNHPTGLLTRPGDTLWLVDARNARFDIITPQGELLPRSVAIPPTLTGTIRASDRDGRLYASDPVAGQDSIQLLRFTSDGAHVDSLIRLGAHRGTNPASTVARYTSDDAWAVSPDGDILLVRPQPYHAECADYAGGTHDWSNDPVHADPDSDFDTRGAGGLVLHRQRGRTESGSANGIVGPIVCPPGVVSTSAW